MKLLTLKKGNQLIRQQVRNFNFYGNENYNMDFKKVTESQYTVNADGNYKFAIVGAGPAGFFMARQCLNYIKNAKVDVFERNPHPYGLVRTGMAPDHFQLKNIEEDFVEVFNDTNRCKFFGNVPVGTEDGISIEKLKELYSAVILTYGATSDRKLGLPHEFDYNGVISCRQMANWYNGSLDHDLDVERDLDLETIQDVAIVGNGNVAMDITRILMKKPEVLDKYDIPQEVINHLKKSKIRNLSLIGRLGAVQSAFNMKELKEVSKIEDTQLYMFKDELIQSQNEQSIAEITAGFSPNSANWELQFEYLKKSCKLIESEEQFLDIQHTNLGKKNIFLRYLQQPTELIADPTTKRIQKVKMQRTQLQGEPGKQFPVSDPKNLTSTLYCQLLIKSIGYQSVAINGVPFDDRSFTVPNYRGAVMTLEGKPIPRMFVSGWLKRGPRGITDATLRDAIETFSMVKHQVENGFIPEKNTPNEEVIANIPKSHKIVSFEQWKQIDAVERFVGQHKGKIREKILQTKEMTQIIK